MSEAGDQPLDTETVNGLIRILMRIDAKLDVLIALFEEDDDDGTEAEPDA